MRPPARIVLALLRQQPSRPTLVSQAVALSHQRRSSINMARTTAPFGSWPSPVTSDVVLSRAITFADVVVSPDGHPFWVEGRPEEKGRYAIVDGETGEDVLPAEVNARTMVHEYGGASVSATAADTIIFSEINGPAFETKKNGSKWTTPRQVTPGGSKPYRFADFTAHPQHSHLVVAVLEDHTKPEPANVVNRLVCIDTKTTELLDVVSGADFYSSGRFSPDGKYICWVEWWHDDMPWNGSVLYVAEVDASAPGKGSLLVKGTTQKLAGASQGVESVSQPRWDKSGNKLVFLSDRSGFYELYKWSPQSGKVEHVLKEQTGKDAGGPDWLLGQQTHAPLGDGQWVATAGDGKLRVIDLAAGTSRLISTPFGSCGTVRPLSKDSVLVSASPTTAPSVVAQVSLVSAMDEVAATKILKSAFESSIDAEDISTAEPIAFPTTPGPDGKASEAYARFYKPKNSKYAAPEGEKPPLIVRCHGGPTSSATRGLDYKISLMTSRGFAYADVDYGGSTGYGREYRERLDKNWGVVDVEDTIACVKYLVEQGMVDGKRVAITGGSAGGYTVLGALCDSDVFTAGTSYYGVADLKLLAGDTHKFESQYLFKLVGGTPEQVPEIYHDRSPLFKADKITAPLLLLQGTIDRVVPPEQAEKMYDVIKSAGGKVDLIMFEGEGHGFRRSDSQKRAIAEEIGHYRKAWSIKPFDAASL